MADQEPAGLKEQNEKVRESSDCATASTKTITFSA